MFNMYISKTFPLMSLLMHINEYSKGPAICHLSRYSLHSAEDIFFIIILH